MVTDTGAYGLEDWELQSAAPWSDAAIDWVRGAGWKVWIALHGALGSQPEFDDSGHKTLTLGWQQGNQSVRLWQFWKQSLQHMRGYFETQLSTFEDGTQGLVSWNLERNSAHGWQSFILHSNGILPQPLTGLKFSAIVPSWPSYCGP
jgi:hypothetical protein